jgi:uncharacterized Fe-S center protein
MTPFLPDLGALASTDPVAIDQAAPDLVDQRVRRTVFRRGRNALAYAEKLGVGSRRYELVTLEQPGAVALAG